MTPAPTTHSKWWCFFGVHQYETVRTGPRNNDKGQVVGFFYDLRCKCCGKISTRNT